MRKFLSILWLAFLAGALYIYFLHPNLFQTQLEQMAGHSIYYAYAFLLVLGIIRGFTLIPITYLIVLGLLVFKPLPLSVIIVAGALVSSLSVYYFFEFLNLDVYFEKHHAKRVHQIKGYLEEHELPIIILWSACPFLPTDIICYICGTLEVDVKKFLLGILIGEGVMCGIYIYFGKYLLDYLHFVF